MMLYLEVGVVLAIILGIMWMFGMPGEKILTAIVVLIIAGFIMIIAGFIMGIGIQLSYVLLPIAGG